MWLSQSRLARDLRWVVPVSLLYALAVIAATLSLNRYFSQTWDVMTFADSARNFLPGADWQALYAQTRSAQQWPYAYPPLHAMLIAPLLALAQVLPDWLLVRVPPLLADVGVGALVYTLIARKTDDRFLARLGLAVWLFNPVTLYDTAVQGHFEAEWLFFMLLGYLLAGSRRGLLAASVSFAVAFLFKQVAIIFILPFWVTLALDKASSGAERVKRLVLAGLAFALPVLLVSLPFLLYSGDYLYMNLGYVAAVPLQTQSWLVALNGLVGNDFWLLQHSMLPVALAALSISFVAARRGLSLSRAALLIVIALFLFSQKVMGYYYAMLLPFALVELIPARRTGLLTLMVAATAWISLSPYFASWAQPAHWIWYAALGTLNSLFWLGATLSIWRMDVSAAAVAATERDLHLLFVFTALLFVEMTEAALAQPLVNSAASPIRAPLIAPGLEANALAAFVVLAIASAAACGAAWVLARRNSAFGKIPKFAFLSPMVYLPLYFLTFTLTKESTAAFETLLKSLGF